jgi:hypothetical protein
MGCSDKHYARMRLGHCRANGGMNREIGRNE